MPVIKKDTMVHMPLTYGSWHDVIDALYIAAMQRRERGARVAKRTGRGKNFSLAGQYYDQAQKFERLAMLIADELPG